jgi:flavodoxin
VTTAVIVYRSATGTTRRFAEEIGAYIESRGVEVAVQSVGECDPTTASSADIVLLGCWTSGLLVVGQHPDEPWLAFVRELPALGRARVGLFTTYKLATGSMFRRMRSALGAKAGEVGLELRSRDGHLTPDGRAALGRLVAAAQP